jgi:HK97 family phage major capsid protein
VGLVFTALREQGERAMQQVDTPQTARYYRERIESLALEAKSILEPAKRENREFTKAEDARFDEITEKLIPALKVQEAAAIRYEKLQLAGHHVDEMNYPQLGNQQLLNRDRQTMHFYNNGSFNPRNDELQRLLSGQPLTPQASLRRVSSLRAFRSEQAAYDAGQWLKALVARTHRDTIDQAAEEHCKNRGLVLTNVGNEGSGPSGGYLVPAPLAATIIEVREMVGVARKVCNVMPSGETLTVPKRAGGLTVYAPGEAATITDSDKQWGQVGLVVKKRAVATFISQELNDDSIINITDNLFVEMGYALALQEDNELVNGDGSGATYFGVRGLLNRIGSAGVSSAAAGHDTWPELDIADLAACVGKLPDRFFAYGPGWICSHSFFNQVMARIAFSAGGVTMNEVMSGSPNVRAFMGYPVYLTSQMPTATAAATVCALFGAFSQAVILADRGGVRLDRSDDYKFLDDVITLKGTSRYDINVHEPGTASAAGAYVALKTAA